MSNLILASGSRIRAKMLQDAGVVFDIHPATIDETKTLQACHAAGMQLPETAERLAEEKALAVSGQHPGWVIGSDQILGFEGTAFESPENWQAAKQRLAQMAGKSHTLNCGVALCKDGKPVWRYSEVSTLTMRDLTTKEIEDYAQRCDDDVLKAVGAYQIESIGIRLFETIKGNHFSILGMPLLPLLNKLRALKVLAW